jgi:thiamine biosynthesis protein ThiS
LYSAQRPDRLRGGRRARRGARALGFAPEEADLISELLAGGGPWRYNARMIRVNDQYEVEHRPGMTVQDLLAALNFSFKMIVVKIDGQVVLRKDFPATEVPDGAEVQAIHLISGG